MIDITAPLVLPNGQTLKNRLVKGAMTEGLADARGRPTPELIRLYERWADGGTGLLLTGNIQIDRAHLERAGNVIIDRVPDAAMAALLGQFARAGQRGDTRNWAQLSHAGRQTPFNINPAPKAPSVVKLKPPTGMKMGEPVALTEAEIGQVIEGFVIAAQACQQAGFDGVQIHAAHGYLLSQFLSPKSNQRSDQWGGSLENRARLLLEVARRIKPLTSASFGLAVKLNSADFQRGGFELDDSVTVARWLDAIGIDFLEISGGNYEAPEMVGFTEDTGQGAQKSTHAREAYFLEFAPRIAAALARSKLLVTGGFRTAAAMNGALNQDQVDLIGIGRPLCAAADTSARLLAGTITELPRHEDEVQLGGGILSQRSPIGLIKRLTVMMSQAWYYQNLVRLAKDQTVLRPGQLFKAVLEYTRHDSGKAKALKAARD